MATSPGPMLPRILGTLDLRILDLQTAGPTFRQIQGSFSGLSSEGRQWCHNAAMKGRGEQRGAVEIDRVGTWGVQCPHTCVRCLWHGTELGVGKKDPSICTLHPTCRCWMWARPSHKVMMMFKWANICKVLSTEIGRLWAFSMFLFWDGFCFKLNLT